MLRREFLIGTLATSIFPKSVFASADALIVNRTESCGCCGAWVERMISGGFKAEVNFVDDEVLRSIKSQLGVTADLSSCHTATIGSYFIEGHVPAEDIRRLLIERPKALGLSVAMRCMHTSAAIPLPFLSSTPCFFPRGEKGWQGKPET